MRRNHDKLRCNWPVIPHTEASRTRSCRPINWPQNAVIVGVFENYETRRWNKLSTESDSINIYRWRIGRALNLNKKGHKRLGLVLINSNRGWNHFLHLHIHFMINILDVLGSANNNGLRLPRGSLMTCLSCDFVFWAHRITNETQYLRQERPG